MYLRSYIVDNGGVDWRLWWYECNRCKKEVHESWPHYAERENNIHFCWDCSYIEGKITEKEHLKCTGVGWMKDAHSSIVNGKVITWIGKTAPWERTLSDYRRTKQYRVWRLAVLKRDKQSCKHCGSKQNLQAHHIKPFAKYENHRYKVSNGLALCEKCHRVEHKRMKQGDRNVRRISNK